MITPSELSAENRINQKIEQIKNDIGVAITNLLKDANKRYLKTKGKVSTMPTIDHNNLRWTLAWTEEKITFDLSVVIAVTDNGTEARVDRVWVHRHVTTPFDYDGHTPTTHMRRLTSLSIAEIKSAVEAEFS
ncbi:MAG: hypothetical protein HZB51_03380 [Chloroflexi bacterium]|nr:hypothetical protein [Chloroflexota bacterium]